MADETDDGQESLPERLRQKVDLHARVDRHGQLIDSMRKRIASLEERSDRPVTDDGGGQERSPVRFWFSAYLWTLLVLAVAATITFIVYMAYMGMRDWVEKIAVSINFDVNVGEIIGAVLVGVAAVVAAMTYRRRQRK